jgi:Mg/Co/Ni transporter MgtE
MADDELIGNISTEDVLEVLQADDKADIDINYFNESILKSFDIFKS